MRKANTGASGYRGSTTTSRGRNAVSRSVLNTRDASISGKGLTARSTGRSSLTTRGAAIGGRNAGLAGRGRGTSLHPLIPNFRTSTSIRKIPFWKSMNQLEKKLNTALNKLVTHLRNKSGTRAIQQDRDNIVFLLGEYNYLARECVRLAKK